MRIGLEVPQFVRAPTDPLRYMFSVVQPVRIVSRRDGNHVPPKTVVALTLNSTDTVGALLVKHELETLSPCAPQLAEVCPARAAKTVSADA